MATNCSATESLVVNVAPDFVRPYVLPKYRGRAIKLTPSQIIRFSITANSSGGAFSLVQHNGKDSGWTSARPHTHHKTHEHFYCARGRVELWGKKNATDASHEARVGTVGDYGNIPPGSIHTFQLTDPDTQLSHVFHPGGFEDLFDAFSLGDWATDTTSSPYLAISADDSPFGPLTPEADQLLRGLDLYAAPEEEYIPRRDFVNGTVGDSGLNWHNGTNHLPNDSTIPYFVAKDYGPKYLNSESGHKIIQPLATPDQATGGNFSMGTIIMSPKRANESASHANPAHHFALQMEDGQLALSVRGYDSALLIQGDVAFVPAGVPFTYHATVPFTKFVYMSAGAKGLDYELLKNSVEWNFTAYPSD
ncbi:cytochrome P450 oxidoreductase [Purpureocillium lavendulum]|uniref:Cytochrome P450 oxidoreductase n=1 Tax=Purpureocillium lavendulum TaxID=1247861 RepID=A0AB34FWP1_9HYPO|nr:cytochrome P450 oxidoreductase [Purpureocillium lavendulum]